MTTAFYTNSHIGTYEEGWHDKGFHRHPTLEISIVLEGRGLFEWPKRKHIVETGHIIAVPPELPHRYASVSRVRFGVLHLAGYETEMEELLDRLVPLNGGVPRLFALSRLDKERFERLFREWLRVKASFQTYKHLNTKIWTEMLLLFLLEHLQTNLQAMTVTKAADYIREHLRENVLMADLAELAGMTVAGFRRLFETTYDLSPKQYQQQCRFQEAKWLLSATGKDMQEIAGQIGFSRLHSFSEWFKGVAGMSPTAWRRSLQLRSAEPATDNDFAYTKPPS